MSGPLFRRPASRRTAAPPGRIRGYIAERKLLGWILLAVVGFFVAGYLLTWVLFFPGFGRSAIVTVPDLTGMRTAAAERTLGRLGLEAERGDAVSNPRIGAGRVLMQVPLPGEEVARGATIRYVPSAGPELRTVPAVRGMPRRDGVGLMERYGFRVAVREVSDRTAAGTVVGSTPSAGEPAAVGSAVELAVSSGPPFVGVPAVTGIPRADAAARLEAAGLAAGEVAYDEGSPPDAWGTVVAQRPAAGDSLRMGSRVRLTVAGPDPSPPPPPEPEPADLDGDGLPDAAPPPAETAPTAPPAPEGTRE